MRSVVLVLLAIGCSQDKVRDGTAVGNPGNMQASAIDVPNGMELTRADLAVSRVGLLTCDGFWEWVPLEATLDGIGDGGDDVPLPAGTYCLARVELGDNDEGGQLLLEGMAGDVDFLIRSDPGTLLITDRFVVDGSTHTVGLPIGPLFGIGGSNNEDAVDDGTGEVGDTDEALADFFPDLEMDGTADTGIPFDDFFEGEAAWPDDPQVGLVGGREESDADSPALSGDEAQALGAEDSGGCGCSSSPAPISGWLAAGTLGWLLAWRRRRRPA